MKYEITEIPDYDFSKDKILINLMICTVFMSPMYASLIGYLIDWMKLPWIFISVIITLLLFFVGQKIQIIGARLQKFEKPEYDPEKSTRDYIKIRKSLLSLLFSLAVGAVFFTVAYFLRKYYMANLEHETTERSTGYVYEILAGVFGFVTAYFPSILWFIPDDILYSEERSVLYYIMPAGIVFISLIYIPTPVYLIASYVAVYFVLFFIRASRISKYNKMVQKLKKDAEYRMHQSRLDI